MGVMDELVVFVQRAVAGDREAFSELASQHWRRMVGLARSVVADLDAEDVVQDALIKAWRKLDSLREAQRFPSWLARIVMNTALERARRAKDMVQLDENLVGRAPEASVESRLDVSSLLARLAPRQRAVIHLTTIEGLTDQEIGSLMDISASSVRVHRMRARQRLAELVKGGSK